MGARTRLGTAALIVLAAGAALERGWAKTPYPTIYPTAWPSPVDYSATTSQWPNPDTPPASAPKTSAPPAAPAPGGIYQPGSPGAYSRGGGGGASQPDAPPILDPSLVPKEIDFTPHGKGGPSPIPSPSPTPVEGGVAQP